MDYKEYNELAAKMVKKFFYFRLVPLRKQGQVLKQLEIKKMKKMEKKESLSTVQANKLKDLLKQCKNLHNPESSDCFFHQYRQFMHELEKWHQYINFNKIWASQEFVLYIYPCLKDNKEIVKDEEKSQFQFNNIMKELQKLVQIYKLTSKQKLLLQIKDLVQKCQDNSKYLSASIALRGLAKLEQVLKIPA